MRAKDVRRIVEDEVAFRAVLRRILESAENGRCLAAFGDRDERIPFADVERGGLAAATFGVVFKEFDAADEREVAAGHDGCRAVGKLEFFGRELRRAAVEEVAPHRLEKDREAACRAAAGEDDAALRRGDGAHHVGNEVCELLRGEDVAHRDRNLPVAALETLHARERGPLEIFFERRGYGVRLLRGQEPEMELFFVVDEVARLGLHGIGTLECAGNRRSKHEAKRHKNMNMFSFHARIVSFGLPTWRTVTANKSYCLSKHFDILADHGKPSYIQGACRDRPVKRRRTAKACRDAPLSCGRLRLGS